MKFKTIFSVLLLSIFLNSCGTVFNYKKSFTKKTKNINYPILILDAAGLLLFVVPGIVALTIDYTTGNLFLDQQEKEDKQNTPPTTFNEFLDIAENN